MSTPRGIFSDDWDDCDQQLVRNDLADEHVDEYEPEEAAYAIEPQYNERIVTKPKFILPAEVLLSTFDHELRKK